MTDAPGHLKLNYFRNNLAAMRHDAFRAQGMFIGSGVIEAGCKTVVGKRCKQSGMFWNESGAENILTLRMPFKMANMIQSGRMNVCEKSERRLNGTILSCTQCRD